MCLSRLYKEKTKKTIGYKVGYFHPKDHNIFVTGCKETELPVGKWVEDCNNEDISMGFIGYKRSSSYPSGFHIILTLSSARKYSCAGDSIVKVEFDDVVATGRQGNDNGGEMVVAVARKIKILEEVE